MRAIEVPGLFIARMAGSHGKIVPLDENVTPESAALKKRHPGKRRIKETSSRKAPH